MNHTNQMILLEECRQKIDESCLNTLFDPIVFNDLVSESKLNKTKTLLLRSCNECIELLV